MKTDTNKRILDYIITNGEVKASDIISFVGFTPAAVHRQLLKLVEKKQIIKIGSAPNVIYKAKPEDNTTMYPVGYFDFIDNFTPIIHSNFLNILPDGTRQEGIDGFLNWCTKRGFDPLEKSKEYVKIINKYRQYIQSNGLINATKKFQQTFSPSYLDSVYYIDFYSIEIFGKTRLGNLLLYGKQSENLALIKEVVSLSKEKIQNLIKSENIGAVLFVPPTLRRKVQFMKVLQGGLDLNLPIIEAKKITGEIRVAQKSLSKLSDREENARNTIFLSKQVSPETNILIIDDAVGSGATFQEIARKYRTQNPGKYKIIALAITGSANGIVDESKKFDVISEV
jgi:hypoxanthine-guanine phosphoribosyltransferase/DNA-binding Lrp family transcriptional regulator